MQPVPRVAPVTVRQLEAGRGAGQRMRRLAAAVVAGALLAAVLVVVPGRRGPAALGEARASDGFLRAREKESPGQVLQGSATGASPALNDATGVSRSLDDAFLRGAAGGEEGQALLDRLQDVWFVETYSSGRPELGRDATELAGSLLVAGFPDAMKQAIDLTANPCEDMYQFACGRYPFDRFPDDAAGVAESRQRAALAKLLQSDTGAPGVYYRSCMDVGAVEAVGDSVLQSYLSYFDAVSDQSSFVKAVVELNKLDLDVLFAWWIDQDARDNTRQAMTIRQKGCTLPDDSYYLEDSPAMRKHRDAMLTMVTRFFKLVGRNEAEAEAQMVLDFETAQSRIHVSRTEAHGDKGEAADLKKLEELMPFWPWKEWLQELGACTAPPDGLRPVCDEAGYAKVRSVGQPGGTPLEIRNAAYFSRLNTLLERTDLETLKAILRWRVIYAWSRYMSSPFLNLMDEWDVEGWEGWDIAPRHDKCFQAAFNDIAWSMSKLYVDQVLQLSNRDATLQMLEVMRERLLDALPNERWMDPADRTAAQEKLQSMFFQVAFPTDRDGAPYWPHQATNLDGRLQEDAYLRNYILTQRLQIDTYFRTLEMAKVDRQAWGIPQSQSPLRPNAFYAAPQVCSPAKLLGGCLCGGGPSLTVCLFVFVLCRTGCLWQRAFCRSPLWARAARIWTRATLAALGRFWDTR